MNSKIIAAIIVGALVIGGGAFFLLGGDSDDAGTSDASTSQGDNELGLDTQSLEGNFVITASGMQTGVALSVEFKIDENGNYSSEFESDNEIAQIRFVDGVTYVYDAAGDAWYSYPEGSTAAPSLDPSSFGLNDDEIAELSQNSTLEELGEEDCTAGTCRVWRDVDTVEGETSIVKIDKETNRLSEVIVTGNDNDDELTIIYTYPDDITIEVPDNATPFESGL